MQVIQFDDCRTAADVLERARRVVAKRRESRAPKLEPVAPKPPVNITTETGTVLPAWVTELKIAGTTNVIPGEFVVVRPNVVYREYPRIEDIITVVAKFYQITPLDIYSARRTVKIVFPRQIAAYLAKTMTPRSLPEIGRRFGGRDHTTILHAVRKIELLIGVGHQLADDIDVLRVKICDLLMEQNKNLEPKEVPFTA